LLVLLFAFKPTLVKDSGEVARAMQHAYDGYGLIARPVVDGIGAMEDYAQVRGKLRTLWMR
jgi:hypothetical protein